MTQKPLVVRLPKKIQYLSFSLFLIVFVSLFEGLFLLPIDQDHEFWRQALAGKFLVQWQRQVAWSLVFVLPLFYGARKSPHAGKFTSVLILILGTLWCGYTHQRAARAEELLLSLFVWAKFCWILFLATQLWSAWGESDLMPFMRWFQGLPEEIPKLQCRIKSGDYPLKVNRIDRQGVIVFSERPLDLEPLKTDQISLRFSHPTSSKEVEIPARLSVVSREAQVLGFRFSSSSMDLNKELGDFIERMMGEGYGEQTF